MPNSLLLRIFLCHCIFGISMAGCATSSPSPFEVPSFLLGDAAEFSLEGRLTTPYGGAGSAAYHEGERVFPADDAKVFMTSHALTSAIDGTGAIVAGGFAIEYSLVEPASISLGTERFDSAGTPISRTTLGVQKIGGSANNVPIHDFLQGEPDLMFFSWFAGQTIPAGPLVTHFGSLAKGGYHSGDMATWTAKVGTGSLALILEPTSPGMKPYESFTVIYDDACSFPLRMSLRAAEGNVMDLRRTACTTGTGPTTSFSLLHRQAPPTASIPALEGSWPSESTRQGFDLASAAETLTANPEFQSECTSCQLVSIRWSQVTKQPPGPLGALQPSTMVRQWGFQFAGDSSQAYVVEKPEGGDNVVTVVPEWWQGAPVTPGPTVEIPFGLDAANYLLGGMAKPASIEWRALSSASTSTSLLLVHPGEFDGAGTTPQPQGLQASWVTMRDGRLAGLTGPWVLST